MCLSCAIGSGDSLLILVILYCNSDTDGSEDNGENAGLLSSDGFTIGASDVVGFGTPLGVPVCEYDASSVPLL